MKIQFDYDEPVEQNFKIIEEGVWEDDGKYQFQEVIVEDKSTGKFYKATFSRSGSYYSDYYYPHLEDDDGWVDCFEVEQKEEVMVVKVWVKV